LSDPGPAVRAPGASRPVFAIGDVQGCLDCLLALVARIDAESPGEVPRLWLCGDLVNRGPRSLETLRWAMRNSHRLVTVLGNHDLHLLAVAAGIRPAHASDTLREILEAPDRDLLIDWLRRRPLAHFEDGMLMVHAGVLPPWSAARAVSLAGEVADVLGGPDWKDFLRVMYGNQPDRWDDALEGPDRLRVVVNALTRLRFCTPDGRMEFATKEGAGGAPAGHLPWFEVPGRASADTPVIFGHWSTLGLVNRPALIGLDTGCVWGGRLTAMRLADRHVIDIGCPQARAPGAG
jgi:bis(5'-nucleosyl)-tetraphosphatase (symmetrical)